MAHLSAKKAGIYSLLCAQVERGIGFGECVVFFAIFYKIALKFVQVKCVHARLCPILCDPTMLLCPMNFSGTNTGVGCHSLLQRDLPCPGGWTHISCVSCTGSQFFTTEPPGKPSYKLDAELMNKAANSI